MMRRKRGERRESRQDKVHCLCFTLLHKTITSQAHLSLSLSLENKRVEEEQKERDRGWMSDGKKERKDCGSLKK